MGDLMENMLGEAGALFGPIPDGERQEWREKFRYLEFKRNAAEIISSWRGNALIKRSETPKHIDYSILLNVADLTGGEIYVLWQALGEYMLHDKQPVGAEAVGEYLVMSRGWVGRHLATLGRMGYLRRVGKGRPPEYVPADQFPPDAKLQSNAVETLAEWYSWQE